MPIDRELDSEVSDPIDRLVIALRAYVTRAPKKPKAGAKDKKYEKLGRRVGDWTPLRVPPSDWVLVFDCETRTTPDQRLRLGAYQLRYKGQVWERGAFLEPEPQVFRRTNSQSFDRSWLTRKPSPTASAFACSPGPSSSMRSFTAPATPSARRSSDLISHSTCHGWRPVTPAHAR